ncbi:MAG: tape measure protein [Syntrophomonadaceae bacterium]|nr:tape measure protein [Syntrophomonadaceae bacterium]
MADERYEIEISVNTQGTEQAQKKLSAMEKFIQRNEKQAKALDKLKISPTASLKDRVSGAIGKIDSKLRTLASKDFTIGIKAKDMASGVISKLGLAVAGAGAGIVGGSIYALNEYGSLEQAEMGLDFFMGSAKKGKKAYRELVQYAAKTPFEFPFLQESAIGLMGVYKGTMDVDKAWKESIRDLTAFGNAAGYTGAGMEGMQLAMMGFKQIGYNGTLQMEELRQVSENLRVPMSELGKALGVSSDKLRDIGTLGIPASKAMNDIVTYLEKNFAGGMDKLSQSYLGLRSTMSDTKRFIIAAFGAGLAGPVKRVLTDIVGSTDFTSKKFQSFQAKVQAAGQKIGSRFEAMYEKVKKFYANLSKDPGFQKADFGGKIIIALSRGLEVFNNWLNGPGGEQVSEIMGKLGELFATALEAMIPLLTPTAIALGKALIKGIGSGIKGAITQGLKDNGVGMGLTLFKGANMGGGAVLPLTIYNMAQNFDAMLAKNTPKKATGDIVNRPVYSLIGEDGPEAIVPLSSKYKSRGINLWAEAGRRLGVRQYAAGGFVGSAPALAGGGGNVTVYSSNTINWGNVDEDTLAMEIGRKIVADMKRSMKQALQNRG